MKSPLSRNAQPAETRQEDVTEGNTKVDAGDSIAVVPLTNPALAAQEIANAAKFR